MSISYILKHCIKNTKDIFKNDTEIGVYLRKQAILHKHIIQYIELPEYNIVIPATINPYGQPFDDPTGTISKELDDELEEDTTFKQGLKHPKNKNIIKLETTTTINGHNTEAVNTSEDLQYKIFSEIAAVYKEYERNKIVLTMAKTHPSEKGSLVEFHCLNHMGKQQQIPRSEHGAIHAFRITRYA